MLNGVLLSYVSITQNVKVKVFRVHIQYSYLQIPILNCEAKDKNNN